MRFTESNFLKPFRIPKLPMSAQPYFVDGICNSTNYISSLQDQYGVIFLRPVEKPYINVQNLKFLNKRSDGTKLGQSKLGPYVTWFPVVGTYKGGEIMRKNLNETEDVNIKITYGNVGQFMELRDCHFPLKETWEAIEERYAYAIHLIRSGNGLEYLFDVCPSKDTNEYLLCNWQGPLKYLEKGKNGKISGLTTPWLQIGPFPSITAFHTEDHGLPSININYPWRYQPEDVTSSNNVQQDAPQIQDMSPIAGTSRAAKQILSTSAQPVASTSRAAKLKLLKSRPKKPVYRRFVHQEGGYKLWALIEVKDQEKFYELQEEAIKKCLGENAKLPCMLKMKQFFVPLETLDAWNIGYKLILQKPGDVIITLPGTPHQVMNLDFAVCASQNFMTLNFDYMPRIQYYRPCPCFAKPNQNCKKGVPSCWGFYPVMLKGLRNAVNDYMVENEITEEVEDLLEVFNKEAIYEEVIASTTPSMENRNEGEDIGMDEIPEPSSLMNPVPKTVCGTVKPVSLGKRKRVTRANPELQQSTNRATESMPEVRTHLQGVSYMEPETKEWESDNSYDSEDMFEEVTKSELRKRRRQMKENRTGKQTTTSRSDNSEEHQGQSTTGATESVPEVRPLRRRR